MKDRKRKETTISLLFRTLRSAYNKTVQNNHVGKVENPFSKFKVSKFDINTQKRAISKDDIQKIIQLNLSKISTSRNYQYFDFARDIFLFSYFTCGINIVDIAYLKSENIINNDKLCFYRRKTKKLFSFKMYLKALDIIFKYTDSSTEYLFPILTTQISEVDRYNRVNGALKTINKYLREIGEHLKIETALTTYVARHSFASVLKRSGVNTSIISESLGHSSEKITQIYLDSFENSQIDEAMKNLL